jgi:phenylpropionate dioxygenase-like ring-hydroxylating dioxygenase large terminal subunit
MTRSLSTLIANQQPGFSLQRAFYQDPDVFDREIEQLFLKAWLYVGHVSQIPSVGDYFLFEIAGESVIIVRSKAGPAALLNVCRHRGSRVCVEPSGNERMLVCPYHGWSYQLDGTLRGASHAGKDFDRSRYGLKKIAMRIFQGLIFINFDPNPTSFDPIEANLAGPLRPYRLDRAKVAHRANYPITANWKLAVENYSECHHCRTAHPEYSKGHSLAFPWEQSRELAEKMLERAERAGLSREGLWQLGLGAHGYWRHPLLDGYQTGSRDGRPLAPLLGELTGFDGGAADIQVGPVTFFLAYCDHVVVYRFTPRAVDRADCEISWLVNADAKEGVDYQLDDLTWLWHVTTLADKRIIEDNQAGVSSRFYEPGPYSTMEDMTREFTEWYLGLMQGE